MVMPCSRSIDERNPFLFMRPEIILNESTGIPYINTALSGLAIAEVSDTTGADCAFSFTEFLQEKIKSIITRRVMNFILGNIKEGKFII
jgi:hypothetical protein